MVRKLLSLLQLTWLTTSDKLLYQMIPSVNCILVHRADENAQIKSF